MRRSNLISKLVSNKCLIRHLHRVPVQVLLRSARNDEPEGVFETISILIDAGYIGRFTPG
jgi:hypothetical protein